MGRVDQASGWVWEKAYTGVGWGGVWGRKSGNQHRRWNRVEARGEESFQRGGGALNATELRG